MNTRSIFTSAVTAVLLGSALVACSGGDPPRVEAKDTTAPVTSLNPPPGTFEDAVLVALTASEAATISFTTDGSDPTTSPTATTGASPQQALLKKGKTTLKYFAKDAAGNAEATKSAVYGVVEKLAPASISGEVRVHESMRAGSVIVALYGADPAAQPPPQPLSYQQLTIAAGTAGWKFESLPAGDYWIAAAWWPGPVQGDPQGYVIAHGAPFTVDPADPAKARVDFVVLPFGQCDEASTGYDGTVTIAPELQGKRVAVIAFDGPITGAGTAKPLAASLASGTGASRPFALCDLKTEPAYVVVLAQESANDAWDIGWTDPASPMTPSGLRHQDYKLGLQDAALGSVSGTVSLSTAAVGGFLTVYLTPDMPNAYSPLLSFVRIPLNGAKTYNYSLHNVGAGKYFVVAVLNRPGARDAYGLAPNQPVIALPTAPVATADISLGLGRVKGEISVKLAGAGSTVFLSAVKAGTNDAVAADSVTLGDPDGQGVRRAAFQLDGLVDGSYEVVAVYDANDDGHWEDDAALNHMARSAAATVSQAGEATTDVVIQ